MMRISSSHCCYRITVAPVRLPVGFIGVGEVSLLTVSVILWKTHDDREENTSRCTRKFYKNDEGDSQHAICERESPSLARTTTLIEGDGSKRSDVVPTSEYRSDGNCHGRRAIVLSSREGWSTWYHESVRTRGPKNKWLDY